MPKKLSNEKERKHPHSFSCKDDLWEDFVLECANNNEIPSNKLREFMEKYVGDNK
ncbi:MAG: hypothetical protein ACOCV1_00175 [Bacillota bacterium]